MSNVSHKRSVGQAGRAAKDWTPRLWGVSGKAVGDALRGLPPELGADVAMIMMQHAAGFGPMSPSNLAEMVSDDLLQIADDRPQFFLRLLATMGQLIAEEYSLRPVEEPEEPAAPTGQAPARRGAGEKIPKVVKRTVQPKGGAGAGM